MKVSRRGAADRDAALLRRRRLVALASVLAALLTGCAEARPIRPADIEVPKGFKIDAAVRDLAAPTMVAFDDRGRMLIAESGYRGGGNAKVTRIEPDCRKTVLVADAAFGNEKPLTSVAFNDGKVYVAHAGSVSTVEEGGRLRPIITGLPGRGDHQANQLVFRDGFVYLSILAGTEWSDVAPTAPKRLARRTSLLKRLRMSFSERRGHPRSLFSDDWRQA